MVIEISVGNDWRFPQPSRVVRNINAARKFRKFTDVKFVVGDDEDACIVKAHRVVLGTVNASLANLISGSDNLELIRITDVSPRGFKNVIRYLYDGDVKFTDLSSVLETRYAAEKFKLYRLKLATENCLHQAVHYESLLEMLEVSIDYDMPELRWKCIDMISNKYQDVLKSEEFASASFDVVEAILSNPCHGEECQYYALEAIGRWKKKHKTNQEQLENLLKCVDFAQLRMPFLRDFQEGNDGILSNVDFRALELYILMKDVHQAPLWYRSEKHKFEKNSDISTKPLKREASEMSFPEFMKKQKLKVQEALNKERHSMEKSIMKAADSALEFFEKGIHETAEKIGKYISGMIKEAVETSVDNIEDDMKCIAQEHENIRFEYVEESDATMEVASASETDYDSAEESGTILNSTDSVESCETLDVKRGATPVLAECH